MLTKLYALLKHNYVLIVITIGAFLLRIVALSEVPPSLNWDEVSHGYNAFSILKTGKDEWGNVFPIIFRAYGDYKLPVYIYLTVFSEIFFGLTTFAVRLPSALAGTLTVLFTYLLVKELFKVNDYEHIRLKNYDGKVALISAFLVAIEPWSLFLSRGAFEANLALSLFVGGAYFLLKGFQKPRFFLLSSIFIGLTVWTYNSYRLFSPIMVLVAILLWKSKFGILLKNKSLYIFGAIAVLLTLLIPMFWQLTDTSGRARYEKVAILDEGAINKIIEERNNNDYNPFIERALYNKGTFFIKTVIFNWATHFSTAFLFTEGGSQFQYNIPGWGLLYKLNAPFIIIGFLIVGFLLAKKSKSAIFIFCWIIFAPLPGSITRDNPHTLRAITMIPTLMILASLGIVYFCNLSKIYAGNKQGNSFWPNHWKVPILREKTLYVVYILLLMLQLENYLDVYFNDYKNDYSWSWQYGYEDAVGFVKENYTNYDKIIMTKKYGEPHMFLLTFWPWDPNSYRNDPNLIRYEQSDWYWVDRFDKFYFVNDWDIPTRSDLDFKLESGLKFDCDFSKCLLVTSPGNHQQDWKLIKTIKFVNGEPAFEILDYTGK